MALAQALASPGVALTYLDLGKNGLGDEDGKAMRSSEYGQGAKIAFLSVDDKIIAEIIALERVTEQGADDKTPQYRGSNS